MKKTNWAVPLVVIETALLAWRYMPSTPPVYADIPDAGAQRNDMIDQLKSTNEKLDAILKVLNDGKLKVVVDGQGAEKPQ